jgi:hypothetical protein
MLRPPAMAQARTKWPAIISVVQVNTIWFAWAPCRHRSFRPVVIVPVHTLDRHPHVYGKGTCGGTVVELVTAPLSAVGCAACSRTAKKTKAFTRKTNRNIAVAGGGRCLACVIACRATGTCSPGKSALKRAAMSTTDDSGHRPLGRPEIIDVSRFVAVSFDCSLKRAASSQGSTPSRASADRAVRTMPLSSSPIGAYKKSLYAEVRSENTECGMVVDPLIGSRVCASEAHTLWSAWKGKEKR